MGAGLVNSISVHPEDANNDVDDSHCFSSLFKINHPVKMVKNIGSFVVALISDQLHFYDQNFTLCFKWNLKTKKIVEVLDFEFLDVENSCEFYSDVKILLKVLTSSNVVEVVFS